MNQKKQINYSKEREERKLLSGVDGDFKTLTKKRTKVIDHRVKVRNSQKWNTEGNNFQKEEFQK